MTATEIDKRAAAEAPPLARESSETAAAQARLRRRRWLVNGLRLGLLVAALGGWEIAARLKWIDPFFFAMPSTIADQIWVWLTEGTSQGPLWQQVLVTLEETVLGFLIGAVARHHLRHRARPQPPAGRCLQHLHQDRQFGAARGAGLDLHHLAGPRHGVEGRAGRGHGLLRRLRQCLPGRARGRPQSDRQCPHPRRLARAR